MRVDARLSNPCTSVVCSVEAAQNLQAGFCQLYPFDLTRLLQGYPSKL